MKEEKVRIRVRLTEEENQKLEHGCALCGLSQSEYVRQLCLGIRPKNEASGSVLADDERAVSY